MTAGKAVNIWGNKVLYIVGLSILIAPIVSKKRIQELKFTTYVLFLGVISLMGVLVAKLASEGSYASRV